MNSLFRHLHLLTMAMVLAALAVSAPTAKAQDATIALHIGKAGFIVGAAGGNGTLTRQGRDYPLDIAGLSVGLTIGAAAADMIGTVDNLEQVSDIEGIYAAAGGSVAAGGGGAGMVLQNTKGVVLRLRGKQAGIMASIASSGVKISLK